jgi:hypothetical protein
LALKPDPLDKPRKDDFPFVVTGCLGLVLLPFGAAIAWAALVGRPFYGNLGRTMEFSDKLWMSVSIGATGAALLAITVWGLRRAKGR